MAFDPAQEEYRRLSLRFARTQEIGDAYTATRAAAAFRRRFAWNHDSLPQTDQDRAFHLVARASELVDRELPFAEDGDVAGLVAEARSLLEEAVSLDPECHDARRMLAAQECPSFEEHYRFLVDNVDEVRGRTLARRNEALASGRTGADIEARLVSYPLYRWLASLAARALVCGRYRKSLEFCREVLEMDPKDHADARFTAYLALAKLEDADGLEALADHAARNVPHRPAPDAWLLIASMALAARRGDRQGAHRHLQALLDGYPHAGMVLSSQSELPDGVFARLAVEPYSNDELVLAVSESSVVFQEGVDLKGMGALGSFVAADPSVVSARISDEMSLGRTQDAVTDWRG
ncbi:response regulator receiver protein [Coriobacteriaceae bacterium]|nr:response regulator receiver protein [Atopobiaceae bacterium FL090493]TGY59457.1 response regulator receiver protein [Coriobacteriaceae bacterium]